MNKSEIVKVVMERSGIKKNQAEAAVNTIFNAIRESLKRREKVAIVGFGSFEVVERRGRVGINPATKEKIKIPAKNAVKFKPSASLKDELK